MCFKPSTQRPLSSKKQMVQLISVGSLCGLHLPWLFDNILVNENQQQAKSANQKEEEIKRGTEKNPRMTCQSRYNCGKWLKSELWNKYLRGDDKAKLDFRYWTRETIALFSISSKILFFDYFNATCITNQASFKRLPNVEQLQRRPKHPIKTR